MKAFFLNLLRNNQYGGARKILRVYNRAYKLKEQDMLSIFEDELKKIDLEMKEAKSPDIPHIFRKIPLDVYGKLLLNIPTRYLNIRAFFPSMPSEQVQINWTGAHGEVLLKQSLGFVRSLISGYAAMTGKKIKEANILDYGCGWGRIIRLLYKFTPIEKIYGVDPWSEAINICMKDGVLGNLKVSDYIPHSLPFERKFDLIFAFSVFTHLSEKTAHVVLKTLRKYIADDGLLVITIRPKEYWHYHDRGKLAIQMIKDHEEKGFAFTPHNRPPIDGDITYGDASIALSYFEKYFSQWEIKSVECNDVDPYQVILFLEPV